MRHILLGTAFAVFLTASSVSAVSAEEKSADELAVEGLSRLMDALSLFVDAIPQYSAPEILDNGDIIIRRKNRKNDDVDDDEEKPEIEETTT